MTISARRAILADAPGMAAVHVKSWNETMRPLKVYSDDHVDAVNSRRLQQYTDRLTASDKGLDPNRTHIAGTATDPITGQSTIIGLCVMGKSCLMEAYPDYPLELCALYLDSSFHGTGAAQKMIAEGIRVLGWSQSSGKMLCEALEANGRACRFYEKIGGRLIGREITTKYGGFAVPMVTFGWDSVPLLTISIDIRKKGLLAGDFIDRANETLAGIPESGSDIMNEIGTRLVVAVTALESGVQQIVAIASSGLFGHPKLVHPLCGAMRF
ncbi:UNVERIFIED_CONTAM: hypothetical protein HDU68_011221 [Siphonaria sp. JEL0065]|nr:hypothetical protein HDU68_011221 [Siphonaria sp. JEL0065]